MVTDVLLPLPLRAIFFSSAILMTSGGERGRPRTIVVIPRSTSTDTAKRMRQGVMDLTHQGAYVVSWKAPQSESDYTQQANRVREATDQQVAGTILVPDHQLVLAASVQHAKDLGIPVVIVGAPISLASNGYDAFVGSNDSQIALLAADRISFLLGGKGQVGIVGVSPMLEGFNRREAVFAQRLHSQHPGIEVVGTEYGLSDWARATNAAQDLLARYPQISAIFASDGYATMATIAVLRKQKPRHIILVGVDLETYVMDALRTGDIDGVVALDWYRQGRLSMDIMQAALAHKPHTQHAEVPAEMVTRQTIDRLEIRSYLPLPGMPAEKSSSK